MAISDWPSAERPREKLIYRGAKALSDAELLAIFLRTGVAGSSAVDLARQLLLDYGSLRGILDADVKSFCTNSGSYRQRSKSRHAISRKNSKTRIA